MTNTGERDLLCDGELEVFPITDSLHDDVIEFYKKDFLRNENISKALNIAGSEHSVAEVEPIVRFILQDNLGYIVRHSQTKETIGICVNKLEIPNTDPTLNYKFQSPAIIRASEFLHQIKGSFDIFDEWNLDCVMEIVFLSTRKDFGGRGLASILTERSIEFARKMMNGTLSQKQKDVLPEQIRELRPKAVYSIFSSLFTQKIGEKLDFETFTSIPYAELFYEGKSFAESIDPQHKVVTLAGKTL